MTTQSDLIQALIALNTAAGTRVHDDQVPQKTPFPFIASTVVSSTQQVLLGGAKLFARTTVRIGIFARQAPERDAIAKMIRDAYNGFVGEMGSTVISFTRVEDTSDTVEYVDGDNVIKGKGLDLLFVHY